MRSYVKNELTKHAVRILAIGSALYIGSGCKNEAPAPAPPPPAASEPKQDDLKAIGEFLKKDAPKPGQTAELPTGHPPIGGAPAPDPAGALPPGHPPIGSAAAIPPAGNEPAAIAFEPPAAWTSEPVSSSMRKAQYRIPGSKGPESDGLMVVFYFGTGQGGSVDLNIDRWKGMFSTADGKPVPDTAIKRESREVNGMKVTTLDVTGRYVDPMAGGSGTPPAGDSRMLSAIIETTQGLWFFKGVGPVETMSTHTENFMKFVDSVKKK
jgi:hypothetical protein